MNRYLLSFVLICGTLLFADDVEINNLLEKLHQTPNSKEKQILIQELKQKLADVNKQTQAKADAIIKAKEKIPLKNYKKLLLHGINN